MRSSELLVPGDIQAEVWEPRMLGGDFTLNREVVFSHVSL